MTILHNDGEVGRIKFCFSRMFEQNGKRHRYHVLSNRHCAVVRNRSPRVLFACLLGSDGSPGMQFENNLRAQYFVALPHVSLLKLPRQKNSCRHKQFLYEFMTRNNVGCRKSFNQRRRKQIITVHETLPPGNTKRQRTNEKRECDVRKEKIAMSRSSSKELETQTNAQ